ncbi:MAG: EAL domain-containing protein [Methylotenera sp.]|nr:EAL domain-containing protein [Methylotenera sp.]
MLLNKRLNSIKESKLLPWLLAAVVMLAGITIIHHFWRNAQHENEKKLYAALESSADVAKSNIISRFDAIFTIMRGVKGFVDGSTHVEPEEFHRYIEALKLDQRFGVRGVALVELVSHTEKERHLVHMLSQGFAGYAIKPEGVRKQYAPITLIEPLDEDNIKAIGLDVFTVPAALQAMELSRDLNQPRLSSRLKLVQDADKADQYAFVIYLPIYKEAAQLETLAARRNAISGWVDVPFRINDFMAGLAGQLDTDVDIEIHQDEPPFTAQSLLFHSNQLAYNTRLEANSLFSERKLEIGGSQWTLRLNSTPAFEARLLALDRSLQLAGLGLAITFLLSLLAWFLVKQKQYAEGRYRALFEQAGDGVLILNHQHQFVDANHAALNLLGYEHHALMQMQLSEVLVHDAQFEPSSATHQSEPAHLEEWHFVCKNGEHLPTEVSCRSLTANSAYFVIIRDLTERKQSEQKVQRLTHLYQALSEINQAIVRMADERDLFPLVCRCAVDFGGMKMAWIGQLDASSQRILPVAAHGDGVDYVNNLNLSADVSLPEGRGPTGKALRENRMVIINDYTQDEMTLLWHEKVKNYHWNAAAAFPIQRTNMPFAVMNIYHDVENAFDDEAIALFKEIASDISFALDNFDREARRKQLSNDLKDTHEQVQFLSNFDPLTKLPNRSLLADRSESALAMAKRAQSHAVLMYLDLDRFKIVNESLGPTAGDMLLKALSERLLAAIKPEDTLSRQGGDEFVLLLPHADAEAAAHIAQNLLNTISRPFNHDGQRITLTASIGIAEYPQDGKTFEQLSQSADAALFRAKKAGRNNFQFFAQQMHEQANEMLQIENDLRHALENNELILHYQPQFDAKTSGMIGMEALIRWQHPHKGLIPPNRFIPIAEESGLITEIGDWVLLTALQQLASWQAQGLAIVPVAVNLSVVQFRQDTLYLSVSQALRTTKLAPDMLELEMTEGIAMEDSERTIAILNELDQLGVRLSIDDFGTGYSSLSYLKRFKIDKLKIDQSFIRDLKNNTEDAAIVVAIIGMAKGLGFKTIAEGVETQDQLTFLQENECDEIQGYFFSKPLPAEAIQSLLRAQTN